MADTARRAFVATVLSISFWAIGVPFWLLLGIFAGVVEIVPVIGPLAAGVVAVGVGLTASWHVALFAGIAVLVVRQFEDYVVIPRVMGHAVGISPLLVLISVTAVGLLFGGFYVLLATPFVAVLVTLVDVIVRDKDPADEETPAVLFAKESRG
jgi:predicted PurR-regulated permease PerM